jgi:acyl dehydratase
MTPFGGTIAHGFLMLSLMPVLASKVTDAPMVEGTLMGINYGGNAVRFLTPVRSGSTVRGRFKLLSFIEKSPGRWLQTMEFTVEIQGTDKPALVAEWMTLIVV